MEQLRPAKLPEMRIDTDDAATIRVPPRRVAPGLRDKIDAEVKRMKDAGIIVESDSPWGFAVVVVPKKEGIRLTVDYQALNDITIPDAYPLSRIDDTLEAMAGSAFHSSTDAMSGFFQIDLRKEDRLKTAFSTSGPIGGHYMFTMMNMGLRNAPAQFQRCMDHMLMRLRYRCALAYLDELITYSKTFEQHLKDLREVPGFSIRFKLTRATLNGWQNLSRACCTAQFF